MKKTPAMLQCQKLVPAKGAVNSLVVLLHGLGSSSDDLYPLGQLWQSALSDTAFIAVDAPDAYDMAPADFGGRQWFSMIDSALPKMLAGAEQAAPILHQFLDQQLAEFGLSENKLALMGFSQGAMMALHVGLRRNSTPAAILAYSGLLLVSEKTTSEISSRPAVFLAHGTSDPVVPFSGMGAAATMLAACSIKVNSHASPGVGHTIDQAAIIAGGAFLKSAFI